MNDINYPFRIAPEEKLLIQEVEQKEGEIKVKPVAMFYKGYEELAAEIVSHLNNKDESKLKRLHDLKYI
ncbi:hypothetical protein HZP82_04675 [Elizabethkingia anophelis]|nr:hypothetical protein [Elizabethkingia anophelis]MCT4104503.1 hypothetical protein [Elizabethkingia anophelis]